MDKQYALAVLLVMLGVGLAISDDYPFMVGLGVGVAIMGSVWVALRLAREMRRG
ncbi:MAG: hypothetical protein MPK30_08330 [Gammaproteobacteria bacterium]|nr:hypothetical protein [Gammaproteobacteria bacterium]